MVDKKLTDKITDVVDTMKTSIELASNIEKCCDPNNNDKAKNIVGIVGNGLVLRFKIGNLFTEIVNDKDFKLQINSSLSMLKVYVDKSNPFYIDTYNAYYNIDRNKFKHIMHEYSMRLSIEYPNDTRVQDFWRYVNGTGKGAIPETEFDYGMSKIRELDCKMIRSNNHHLDSEYVERVLIPLYSSFSDDVLKGLRSELGKLGRIV